MERKVTFWVLTICWTPYQKFLQVISFNPHINRERKVIQTSLMKKVSLKENQHIWPVTCKFTVVELEMKSSLIWTLLHSTLLWSLELWRLPYLQESTKADTLKGTIPHVPTKEGMPSFSVSASRRIRCHLYARIKAKNGIIAGWQIKGLR